ncbi:MAG: hypothetical protein GY811_07955 [Myxococcales bacterium]|nr:hypothetical protein [Myxococcales bacterium]
MRSLRRALLPLFVFGVALSGLAHAKLDGEIYTSNEWRVSLKGPRGWRLSEHSSYPSVLLWMTHRRPSARMLFAAETLEANIDSQAYAVATVKKLEMLGFRVRAPQLHSATGAYWMEFDNGKSFLRQALLVPADSTTGFSLTLSTEELRTRGQLLRAFDFSLRSIKPER